MKYAVLEKLRKALGIDHELASQLWNTGNHEARVLATMIADPAKTSAQTPGPWIGQANHGLLVCAISRLASKTSSAAECFRQWCQSDNDEIAATAWNLLNGALIAIGIRDADLEKLALTGRRTHWKNWTRHGDTACKTPDAAAYIKTAAARKRKMFRWTHNAGRARILSTPWPQEWEKILNANCGHAPLIKGEPAQKWRQTIQVLVAEESRCHGWGGTTGSRVSGVGLGTRGQQKCLGWVESRPPRVCASA